MTHVKSLLWWSTSGLSILFCLHRSCRQGSCLWICRVTEQGQARCYAAPHTDSRLLYNNNTHFPLVCHSCVVHLAPWKRNFTKIASLLFFKCAVAFAFICLFIIRAQTIIFSHYRLWTLDGRIDPSMDSEEFSVVLFKRRYWYHGNDFNKSWLKSKNVFPFLEENAATISMTEKY